jgi:hypothetical protein
MFLLAEQTPRDIKLELLAADDVIYKRAVNPGELFDLCDQAGTLILPIRILLLFHQTPVGRVDGNGFHLSIVRVTTFRLLIGFLSKHLEELPFQG